MTACADFLVRGVAEQPAMRLALAGAARSCSAGIVSHDADPAAAEIFASAVSAAAVSSVLLAAGEKFSIRWRWPGSIGQIVIEAAADGAIRGLVANPHPMADGTPVTLESLLGDAAVTVAVTRTGPDRRVLQSGEISTSLLEPAEALACFFSMSDQIETEIVTALEWSGDPAEPVAAATAVLLQALPGCDLEAFDRVRRRLEAPEARFWLARPASPEEKINRVYDAVIADAGAARPALHPGAAPFWHCDCSSGRFAAGLALLSDAEREEIFGETGEAVARCNFCGRRFTIRRDEVTG